MTQCRLCLAIRRERVEFSEAVVAEGEATVDGSVGDCVATGEPVAAQIRRLGAGVRVAVLVGVVDARDPAKTREGW
jgi:hypothetical protein